MQKAERIAQLLESPSEADPLVIAPRPDMQALRRSGAASIDLRLGSWFAVLRQSRASVLDLGTASERGDAEYALTKSHYVCFGEKFILHPRSFVLGVTLEWIRLPSAFGGYVTSRSSWGRRGLIIATATGVHPGFKGCLTLELANIGELPIALYPGMAICQFFLHKVDGDSTTVDTSMFVGKRKPLLGTVEFDTMARRIAGFPPD